jgi:hypothetical protein
MVQFFPLAFLHSSRALFSALTFTGAVPHPTVFPPWAMAPQLSAYQTHNLHELPYLKQLFNAICFASVNSCRPDEKP